MVYSLFDHGHFAALLKHGRMAALFSEEIEVDAMLRFEAALADAEAELSIIPKEAGATIKAVVAAFKPDINGLEAGVQRDALIVPTLVKMLREAVGPEHGHHVHVGATSQDVIDTGLVLRLRDALTILRDDLSEVIRALDDLKTKYGLVEIMGRTRMQQALPIKVDDRVDTWMAPLLRHRHSLDHLEGKILHVQFGGAVGTLDKLGKDGAEVRALLAQKLELVDPGRAWHAERDRIADLAHWLTQVSGSIGKIGLDLVLMSQNQVGEAILADAGTSSAMPHKRNPVQGELLVTLARLNAGKLAMVGQSMVHEGERSGIAWTLEWMVLPEMIATTASALMIAEKALRGLEIKAP